ncbi:MAG: ABC transporter permease [Oscillospiraceae bacterium]|jgi:ABC-type lipoprotein release transport system permease subunit|nr:ABC transporter permease [Oscillospiraceae bacterium]
MIIRPKDAAKLIGVLIMCACAVLPCALFMNSNIDMARIRDQVTTPEAISLYDATIATGNVTMAVAGGALALTTIVMLLFYIKHYIDTHKSDLGILKALGYSNWSIARGFWVFGLSVFAGAAIGYGIAWAMMPAFYREMRSGGILPDTPLHFNPEVAIYLIVLPTLAFALLSVLYSYRKLRRPALELIRGKAKPRKAKQKDRRVSELPFLRDLKQSTVRSRPSLTFFIGFAAFCYADMVQMSFAMPEMASDMMAIMMLMIGLALAFTTLFIAITTVIKGNSKTLAMLRVFGYSDRECGNAILNGYRPAACIGFIIGTAYQYGLMQMMFALVFNDTLDIPGYGFDIPALIIALVSFAMLYEAIMFLYTKRIKRIPLKEVMLEE